MHIFGKSNKQGLSLLRISGWVVILIGWISSAIHPFNVNWRSQAYSASADPFAKPDTNGTEVTLGNHYGRLFWSEVTYVETEAGASGIGTADVLWRWVRNPRNAFTDGVQMWINERDLPSETNRIIAPGFQYDAPDRNISSTGTTRSYKLTVGYWLITLLYFLSGYVIVALAKRRSVHRSSQ